ncbi:bifunctional 5,10-methylenetetrahydrofolate dehydrogenase/5,10-methenyltetrahydrofolate cyclohydrolase [Fructilactobacillus carniphilus]|uniref:Bifunctional protein FolD n=1 Tax=Fructilactobacillus carniphilus TaxID=2940297 RepID=A0ABY5BYX7_9LACO|nr:tetrahydrofolate dehydrogenase/cyclohydrolase catalytic domain-containing protein [Fructilactobacillus carniphilus]USS91148.1 bifunctional methylenetetrahydrofolate dehydrogenase/methenyltetrahydrofolate cyclohydrolase [Fructilactobacillus carniphilus]
MVQLIDGRKAAQTVNEATKQRVKLLKQREIIPGLAVVLVGHNQASERYVRMKEKQAQKLGIYSVLKQLPEDISEAELLEIIATLNHDERINAILVQSPLPDHLDETKVIAAIDPNKDVDGFHPVNVGKLYLDLPGPYPVACTPRGVMTLLKFNQIPVKGANVVMIGKSSIVGKPLAALLLNAGATVSILHSQTRDRQDFIKTADIVISAVGKAHLLNDADFRSQTTVIDVGQNLDENGQLVGDVDYPTNPTNIGSITPVPGGVGPMTIATLMQQTVEMSEWGL